MWSDNYCMVRIRQYLLIFILLYNIWNIWYIYTICVPSLAGVLVCRDTAWAAPVLSCASLPVTGQELTPYTSHLTPNILYGNTWYLTQLTSLLGQTPHTGAGTHHGCVSSLQSLVVPLTIRKVRNWVGWFCFHESWEVIIKNYLVGLTGAGLCSSHWQSLRFSS